MIIRTDVIFFSFISYSNRFRLKKKKKMQTSWKYVDVHALQRYLIIITFTALFTAFCRRGNADKTFESLDGLRPGGGVLGPMRILCCITFRDRPHTEARGGRGGIFLNRRLHEYDNLIAVIGIDVHIWGRAKKKEKK